MRPYPGFQTDKPAMESKLLSLVARWESPSLSMTAIVTASFVSMFAESGNEFPLPLQPVGKATMIQFILLDSLSQHHLVRSFSDHSSRS
jgi:hypothetical protein